MDSHSCCLASWRKQWRNAAFIAARGESAKTTRADPDRDICRSVVGERPPFSSGCGRISPEQGESSRTEARGERLGNHRQTWRMGCAPRKRRPIATSSLAWPMSATPLAPSATPRSPHRMPSTRWAARSAPSSKPRQSKISAAEARHPLELDGLVYQVRREGNRQFHQETRLSPAGKEALVTEFEAVYAVGSGRTGRSYLIQRDGHLFMSPMTWYADHGWDLSPGYEVNNSHFNRPVVSECLFCHANRALHVEGTLNEYKSPIFAGHAIGCQALSRSGRAARRGAGKRRRGRARLHHCQSGAPGAAFARIGLSAVPFGRPGPRRNARPPTRGFSARAAVVGRRSRVPGGTTSESETSNESHGATTRPAERLSGRRAAGSLRGPCGANAPERLLHRQHGKARLHFVPRPAPVARGSDQSGVLSPALPRMPWRRRIASCRWTNGAPAQADDSCIACHMPRPAPRFGTRRRPTTGFRGRRVHLHSAGRRLRRRPGRRSWHSMRCSSERRRFLTRSKTAAVAPMIPTKRAILPSRSRWPWTGIRMWLMHACSRGRSVCLSRPSSAIRSDSRAREAFAFTLARGRDLVAGLAATRGSSRARAATRIHACGRCFDADQRWPMVRGRRAVGSGPRA